VLIGPSRKAFIRKLLSADPKAPLAPDAPAVADGTLAAATAAILAGAHILRVHDVAAVRAAARIADALLAESPDAP
jgi:dihydropteroate synthase